MLLQMALVVVTPRPFSILALSLAPGAQLPLRRLRTQPANASVPSDASSVPASAAPALPPEAPTPLHSELRFHVCLHLLVDSSISVPAAPFRCVMLERVQFACCMTSSELWQLLLVHAAPLVCVQLLVPFSVCVDCLGLILGVRAALLRE